MCLEGIAWDEKNLWLTVFFILFNPIYWNILARLEYERKVLNKIFCGNKYFACYFLALTIFCLGLVRDHFFHEAIKIQPKCNVLFANNFSYFTSMIFFGIGGLLVGSSMYKLGITGTYLGDYCGILMDAKVESFPFNVTENPMYYGSTLIFLGTSMWYESMVGCMITALVFVMYKIALAFEEPFTMEIYKKAVKYALRSRVTKKNQ